MGARRAAVLPSQSDRLDVASGVLILLTPLTVGLGYAGLVSERFVWVWHSAFIITSVGVLLALLVLVMEAVRGSITAAAGKPVRRTQQTDRPAAELHVLERRSPLRAWRGNGRGSRDRVTGSRGSHHMRGGPQASSGKNAKRES